MARKAKNSDLKRHTHKGRTARTTRSGYSSRAGLGVRGSGLQSNAKLTDASLGRVTPTPRGPEPGRGGTMY